MAYKLLKVKHRPTGKEFFAYPAISGITQEVAWYRPRWWGGETFYWKEDIEALKPGTIKELGVTRAALPGEAVNGWRT